MIEYQTSNIVRPITTDFKNLTERLAHFVQLLHRTVLLVKKFEKAAFAFFGSVLERIIWDLLGSNSDIKRETASSFEKEIDLKQSNFFFAPLQFFRLLCTFSFTSGRRKLQSFYPISDKLVIALCFTMNRITPHYAPDIFKM